MHCLILGYKIKEIQNSHVYYIFCLLSFFSSQMSVHNLPTVDWWPVSWEGLQLSWDPKLSS